ncbi:MAG TPA: VWA domain-containing protein [Gemmataceae bacterium]|nr:VWA domain-containing protein [Gemmataceae bacterium]
MPSFAHPWSLLLLPLAPLVAWAWLRRPRTALRVPGLESFAHLPGGRATRARRGGAILRSLGVAALVLAMAAPRWPDPGTRLTSEGIAIAVVVDVSGSMAEADFPWGGATISRLAAAKRAFRLFVSGGEENGVTLPGRPADEIGVIAFAVNPEDTCPLTLDHPTLLQLLDAEEPRGVPDTGTNIGDAIAWGLNRLSAAGDRRKVLVLLSDGEHNVPAPALTPRQAAQIAANRSVPIYTIDAGGSTAPDARPEDAAARALGRKALESVAAMTNGKSFVAHDSAALLAACSAIDRLERKPIESFQYRRYAEGYPACAAIALACFAAVLGLEATRWRRVP